MFTHSVFCCFCPHSIFTELRKRRGRWEWDSPFPNSPSNQSVGVDVVSGNDGRFALLLLQCLEILHFLLCATKSFITKNCSDFKFIFWKFRYFKFVNIESFDCFKFIIFEILIILSLILWKFWLFQVYYIENSAYISISSLFL